jgi:hypothetical protein
VGADGPACSWQSPAIPVGTTTTTATFWRPFLGLRSLGPPAVTCSLTLGTGIDFPAVSPLRIDCDFEMYNWRHLIERELR